MFLLGRVRWYRLLTIYPFTNLIAGYDHTVLERIQYMLQDNKDFRAQMDELLCGNSIRIAIEEEMTYHSSVISWIIAQSDLVGIGQLWTLLYYNGYVTQW